MSQPMPVGTRVGTGMDAAPDCRCVPDRSPAGRECARMPERGIKLPGSQTKSAGDPYIQSEGAGRSMPARLGRSMPGPRSVTDSVVDRLADILDRILGSIAAPAKPAPVPVPVRVRR